MDDLTQRLVNNCTFFKGAPGWEKFLGGKTSTMQFTLEEVQKLKRQQKLSQQQPPAPPPKPRTSASGLLESSFDDSVPNSTEVLQLPPKNIGQYSKSTPSLEQQPQVSPSARSTVSDSQASAGNAGAKSKQWKNSLDNLNRSTAEDHGIPRGYTAAPNPSSIPAQPPSWHASTSHSHSNSDSGLSSLSGRASTMSPISTMSTVSSVSSASSSGSSSRASLRSASIVSSCTIPLDEEEELEEQGTDTILNRKFMSKLPEESQCELLAQQLLDMIIPEETNYKKLVTLLGKLIHFNLILFFCVSSQNQIYEYAKRKLKIRVYCKRIVSEPYFGKTFQEFIDWIL